jgi:hypothetical protein
MVSAIMVEAMAVFGKGKAKGRTEARPFSFFSRGYLLYLPLLTTKSA